MANENYNYLAKPQVVTIASGGTVSNGKDLATATLCGVETPSAFTGTTITFQGSNDGSTYVPIYDGSTGTQISLTVTTSRGYSLAPTLFAGWRYIKVVSGSSEGADRAVKLCVRQIM